MPMVRKMISKCEKTLSNAGFSLPLSAPVILQSSLANRSHGTRLDQERLETRWIVSGKSLVRVNLFDPVLR